MAAGELTDAQVFGGSGELSDAEVFGPALLNPNLAQQGARAESVQDALRTAGEFASQRDPGIDYRTGVKNAAFRAYFSRMSNDAEKAQFLDRTIGKGAWSKDSFGAYVLQPQGLKRLGIESDMPVALDEQITTRYDVADLAGDAPAVIGAVGYGTAATGLGVFPGMGMAALGAAGGKAIDEIVKNVMGDQVGTAAEVSKEIGKEAGYGLAGEGVGRGIGALSRFGIGPGAARMTPEKKALADSATKQGFKVRPGSVTDAPLLARWEGMVEKIFGDLHREKNEAAAKAGLERLGSSSGPRVTKDEAGEAVARSIQRSRVQFAENFGNRYKEIDDLVGGVPIVPTAPIKQQAEAVLARMPQTAEGKVVGGQDSVIRDIISMGDAMTVQQAQRLRTMMREASESPDLVPGVSKHEARELKKSVDAAFEQAKQGLTPGNVAGRQASTEAINRLRTTDMAYAQGIRQFDKPAIAKIAKDASKGALDADMVVDYLVRPERIVRLRQIKGVVEPQVWGKVKSAHAQDLLSNVTQGTADPLKTVFNGQAFRKELDKYGREVLEEVHGKQWTDDAYQYANALMLANKRAELSGGIVAANIALHPIVNLPKLVWLRGLAKLIEQPGTFKYLTEGFRIGPNTREGAMLINRTLTQAAALAEDETGSATVTLTQPPEKQKK